MKALAKINLGLDVLGKREDGYHDVRMIMQTIHLYDRVEIKKTRSPHIHVETNLYYLPVNEDNLVYRAAKLMKDEFQIKEVSASYCRSLSGWQPVWPVEVPMRQLYW